MRYIHLKLVAPAIIGIVLLIIGLATIPYYGAVQIDAEARQRQEMLVQRNIALWISDIEFSLTAWTIWDESIAKLDNNFDFEWADRNIGASLIGTSRTRLTAVLDSSDHIIYARTADAVKDRAFFTRGADAIVKSSAELVRAVRAREREAMRINGQHNRKLIPQPVVSSRIEVLGDESVLVSASLFQPDFWTAKPKGARAPILITAMPIAGSLQTFFGTRFLLDDARISPLSAVSSDRARAEIAVGPEGEAEVLSWRSPTPGADVLSQSLPLILTVVLLILAGGFFMLRISQTTAQVLVDRERQMRHAASHDFLTGLANRSMIEPEFAALSKEGPVVVVCMDLDGFKSVNDGYGHASGDELLQSVASRLASAVRPSDRLFRQGGDEFVMLMPRLSIADAEQVCRLMSATLALPFALSAAEVSIGASFGISEVRDGKTTCEMAVQAADAALYQAKSAGRGRVVVASNVELVSSRA